MKGLMNLAGLLVATACLVMAVMTVVKSRSNVTKQQELAAVSAQIQQINAAVQQEVRSINDTEQRSRDILVELGNAAMKNAKIREMLAKNNYTLQTNVPPAGTTAIPVTTTTTNPAPAKAPASEVVSPPVTAPVEAKKNEAKEDKP